MSYGLWLLGTDGDTDPTSANHILSLVTLELRLKSIGLGLHLLLKLREYTPGMGVGGWLDREERGSARRKGGGKHAGRQGSETMWPHSEDGRQQDCRKLPWSHWLASSGFSSLGMSG